MLSPARVGLLVLVATGLAAQVPPERRVELVAVPDAAGIAFVHQYTRGDGVSIVESAGSGAGWIDYDVDGDVDLVLANGLPEWGSHRAGGRGHGLFRNDEGRFRRAPPPAGLDERTWGNGVAVADVDNDGFADVLITAIGPDRLYRNMGDGTFAAIDAGVEDEGWGTSAAFFDHDQDGFVDLYVARYVEVGSSGGFGGRESPDGGGARPEVLPFAETCLYPGTDTEVFCGPTQQPGLQDRFYRNSGEGTFDPWHVDDVDAAATPGFALVATDCDNDLVAEIYVANDLSANLLYRRSADGDLEDVALRGGAGVSGDGRRQAGMSAAAADIDGDGWFDVFVTNYEDDHNTLYHNFGNCSFEDATWRYGLGADGVPFMGWGAVFLDIDGDADEDLFVANGHLFPQLERAGIASFGQRNLLFVNRLRERGAAGFTEVGEASGSGMQVIAPSRGVARGDYDDDGDADLLVTNMNEAPTLLRNDSVLQAPALQLHLIGRSSNRTAYGARVVVRSGGVGQHFEVRGSDGFQGSNDSRLLAHLPGGVADVTIHWPSGRSTELAGERAGVIVVDEHRGVVARRDW